METTAIITAYIEGGKIEKEIILDPPINPNAYHNEFLAQCANYYVMEMRGTIENTYLKTPTGISIDIKIETSDYLPSIQCITNLNSVTMLFVN